MSSFIWNPITTLILLTLALSVMTQETAYFQDIFTPHEIKTRAKQKYCGRNLVDVLQLVCAGKGYYHPLKRSGSVFNSLDGDESSDFFGNDFARSLAAKRRIQARGITDECCRQGCSFTELKTYCAEEP